MSCVDLGARQPLAKPDLVYCAAIRADLGPAEEFESSHGLKRAVFPIVGGVLQGEELEGQIIPGGADWAVGLPDGSYAIEARYLIRLSDGTVISILNAGLMVAQPDGAFLGRTRASFEVPAGPHDWLDKSVFFGTATAQAGNDDHVYIEHREAVI
ncbi:DUF3237 family protein [Primorskyibacter sp. 2E107]|uniref:DUF3237 family protein n=1 Tax=Primorskyibacter sp. 2E107 TaxID=3403458 RepID=UPI003AF61DD4